MQINLPDKMRLMDRLHLLSTVADLAARIVAREGACSLELAEELRKLCVNVENDLLDPIVEARLRQIPVVEVVDN